MKIVVNDLLESLESIGSTIQYLFCVSSILVSFEFDFMNSY